MKTLLIAGGSGFVGRHIVSEAINAGYHVKCLCRKTEKARETLPPEAEVVKGDISDLLALEAALEKADAAINLVGIIAEKGENTFESVHVRGVENLTAAMKKRGVSRLLHMSALGTGPDAPGRYFQSKWQGEAAVRESGLDFSIFRPSLIFGRHGAFMDMLVGMVKMLPVIPVISAKGKFQPVSARDVAACFIKALAKNETIGETYELGGPREYTLHEIFDEIARALGRKIYTVQVPASLARIPAGMFERLPISPPVTRDQIAMLDIDNTCDRSKAETTFGLEFMSLKEWLASQ